MSEFRVSRRDLYGFKLGADGKFPAMRELIRSGVSVNLSDQDGLYINYGKVNDPLPFTMQDQYDAAPEKITFETIELENDFLKATFIPALGGRLWGLFDKVQQRELLLDNPGFLPNNLAIRNAWVAGGIEYNIGRRGHDEQTCSPRFTAVLQDSDGTPVVRFYEFVRDRAVPFQIDFYLPEKSRFLFARVAVMNIRNEVTPMYFWSNIAVPQLPGCRVIVPAFDTYANVYDRGAHALSRIPLPDGEGFDGSYPENFATVRDYFYNIPDDTRKYEVVMYRDGYGMLFASTKRLQGRKLFVWGESNGGKHWQRKLVAPGIPDYIEIQGGWAKTQHECLPMPPNTTWEHLEAYGAINMAPDKIFNSWSQAVATANEQVDAILPQHILDAELERTRESFARKPGKVIFRGSGWGALEEARLGHQLAAHLDFGEVPPAQAQWLQLLRHNSLPDEAPVSYLVQPEWRKILQQAAESWQTQYHLGLSYFHDAEYDIAAKYIARSLELQRNAYNMLAWANILRVQGKRDETLALYARLVTHEQADVSLVKECFKVFVDQQYDPAKMVDLWEKLPSDLQERPVFRFFHAYAFAYSGELEKAEAILLADGGLEVGDIREGEISITDLYIYIQQQKARRRGVELQKSEVEIPFKLDLRMQ